MLGNLFARSRKVADRQFDDYLTKILAGAVPEDLPIETTDDHGELRLAREIGAALSPARAVPPQLHDRLWQTVQTRLAIEPSAPTSAAAVSPASVRQRPQVARYGWSGAVAAMLAILIFLTPLVAQRWTAHQFLNVAAAATLPIPPGQVLHCTITTTTRPTGQAARWLGEKEIWLDPERQLARIEYRKPGAGLNRQVFDGRTFSAYATPGSNGGREGLYQDGRQSYAQVAEKNNCSLNDHLAIAQRELLQIDPRRSLATSEELLDGVPVIVLSFAMDARESRAVYPGLAPDPERGTVNLPARYTFTRDGRQLLRLQGWVQTDTPSGVAPIEMRLTYTQAPADRYPASFFSVEAITQP